MEDRIVTIAVHNYARAEVLKAKLQSEGIECYLKNVNVVYSTVPGGVEVRVHQKDMEQALRIIEKANEEYRQEEDRTEEMTKEKVQRILVPVDFSEYSKNACYYAVGLAEKLDAEIKLLHVYYNPVVNSMPMTDTYYYQVNLDEIIRDVEIRAKDKMDRFYKEIKQYIEKKGYKNLTLDYALVRGITYEEIIYKSEEYHPDVMIVGTRGKGEKPGDLIGGVTYKIIERTKVPVLAIPEKSEFQGLGTINIMYVTDFDDSDYTAIRKLMHIMKPFNTRVYCVHLSDHESSEYAEVKMDSFKEHIQSEYPKQTFECDIIEKKDFLESIQEYIEKRHIDIISIVTHKRNIFEKLFHPSRAKKLLFHTNIPLFVFHSSD
ncbi:MAG: universal stress protein [Bacteroidota bacterium]